MSVKDWYAKKLGQQQQQPPPAPAYRPAPADFGRGSPPGVPPVPTYHPNVKGGFVAGADGKVDVVASAASWQGGKGNKDVQNCPECGSLAFYSPNAGGTGIAGRDADKYMRQCYDCGYPIVQFGSHGGLGEQGQQ